MNLCQAIRTGLPIRRRRPDPSGWIYLSDAFGQITLDRNDLLADDWEVKTPTVEVSYGSLLNAFCECFDKMPPDVAHEEMILAIAAHLGLKPYGEPNAQDSASDSGQCSERVRESAAASDRGTCTDLGCGCPTPDEARTTHHINTYAGYARTIDLRQGRNL